MSAGDVATKITLTKLDVVRRQLDTAIGLWFTDGDPVSIHTLASASHEMLHTLYRKKGLSGLLFDSPLVKDEYRSVWTAAIKRHFNFFKHARADFDKTIDFKPEINEFIILHEVRGLREMGEPPSLNQEAFYCWFLVNRPKFILNEFRESFGVNNIERLAGLTKRQFLAEFVSAKAKMK